MGQHNQALIIGINDYINYNGIGSGDLGGCEADAKSFKNILDSDASSWNVKTILSRQATRDAILRELNKAVNLPQNSKFLFYFSGHGTEYPDDKSLVKDEKNNKDVAICPTDVGSGGKFNNLILDDELSRIFSKIRQSGMDVFAIFDCCHSGTFEKDLNMENEILPRYLYVEPIELEEAQEFSRDINTSENYMDSGDDFIARGMKKYGSLVTIGACQDNEVSWEIKRRGLFTSSLTKVFNKRDFLDSFFKKVYDAVYEGSKKCRTRQRPSIYVSEQCINDFQPFIVTDVTLIGVIKSVDNIPVKGANVGIIKPCKEYSTNSVADDYVLLTRTNPKCAFKMSGRLNEGRYKIVATKEGFNKIVQIVEIKKGNESEYASLIIKMAKK